MKAINLTAIFLYLFAGTLLGQTYQVEFTPKQKTNSKNFIFHRVDEKGNIYVIGNDGNVKVINPSSGLVMVEKRMNMHPELNNQGFKYVHVVFNYNKPSLKVEKLEASDHSYYYIDFDHNLNLVGEPYKVSTNDECIVKSKKQYVGSHHLFLDKESGMIMHLTKVTCKSDDLTKFKAILRDRENKLIHEFEFSLNYQGISDIDLTIYNENNYFLKFKGYIQAGDNKKSSTLLELSDKLFHLDNNGNTREINTEILDDGYYFRELHVFKSGGELFIDAQLLGQEDLNFKGMFCGKIDLMLYEISEVEQRFFNKELVKSLRYEINNESTKINDYEGFSGRYKIINYISTEDGGRIYLYQDRNIYQYNSTDPNTGTTKTHTYYQYFDLIPIKLTKNGDIEWLQLIPVHQSTRFFDPGKGVSAFEKNGELMILQIASERITNLINDREFKDKSRGKDHLNKNVIISKIDKNGKFNSEIVLDMTKYKNLDIDAFRVIGDKINNQFSLIYQLSKKEIQLIFIHL